jgi:hypothetical protein
MKDSILNDGAKTAQCSANAMAKRNPLENLLTRLFSVKGFIFLFFLLVAFFASQTEADH